MKKIVILVLALAMCVSLFAACKKEPAAEATIVSISYGGGTPLTSDPALNSASAGSNIIKLSHAGLMGFQLDSSGNGVLAPELAESYTVSEDKLTYTFTLRDGLKWSDGSAFYASDIKKSWERAASEELGADYGFLFDSVVGYPDNLAVVADDTARTIVVTLVAPTPYFLELCAFPVFYPVKTDIADANGEWAVDPSKNIGMGAFRMTEYKVDDVIKFEKNEYYWNADAVKLGGVNCYLSEDNVAILTQYENGDTVFINSIDPVEYDRINATYPGELNFGDYIGTYYFLINVYTDISPTGKQLTVQEQSKARVALGQLINRVELVTYVTKGGQAPATGFYPPVGDGTNANVRASSAYGTWYTGTNTPSSVNDKYTEDQVTAINTLIELGYAYTGSVEGGDIKFTDFPSVEMAFNNSGANAAIMQYVQTTWASVGIPSVINQTAWATLQLELKEGNAEVARMGWIADFNDCVNFLEIFISNSGNNYPRLGRDIGTYTKASAVTADAGLGAYWGLDGDKTWAEAYDALVQEIKLTTDAARRVELCALAEKVLMATGGANPLYFYTNPYMLKPSVQNLIMLPTGDVIWTYVEIKG